MRPLIEHHLLHNAMMCKHCCHVHGHALSISDARTVCDTTRLCLCLLADGRSVHTPCARWLVAASAVRHLALLGSSSFTSSIPSHPSTLQYAPRCIDGGGCASMVAAGLGTGVCCVEAPVPQPHSPLPPQRQLDRCMAEAGWARLGVDDPPQLGQRCTPPLNTPPLRHQGWRSTSSRCT